MRKVVFAGLAALAAGGATLAAALTMRPTSAPAGPGAWRAADKEGPVSLPLSHVHLFSSGVGFFQREGEVVGNARVDLAFAVHDVNDLIKSLVLSDLGGGRISAVSYDGEGPIDKTLRGFAINLMGNPSFAQILNQARGEQVEVVPHQTSAAPPGTLTGTVLGVERQGQAAGKEAPRAVELLNLWCADGMRSIKLADVQRIRFLNPALDAEVKRALGVLARAHDTQKKTVSLNFVGEGRRKVRVGYVVESPIWKTSYRLDLNERGQPALQGWAVVDNRSDEDWKDVRMALVSGRPVSFRMNLYQPLYVPRPLVELDLFASLRPPVHDGEMDWMAAQRKHLAEVRAKGDRPAPGGGKAQLPVKAGAVGEFFQYVLEHPVSLQRQRSALFPILAKGVEGGRVSIYNEATQAKHPLLGLRFKNTTGLHLMQGPVTVYEGGTYAGDARLLDLQPGEQRLISYAIDLGTEVEPRAERPSERLVAVRIAKGVLYATTTVRHAKTYVAKNRSPHDRVLLVEHPIRPGLTLVSRQKPSERTRNAYRFEVKVPAGKTVTLEVAEEQPVVQEVTLFDANDQTVLRYVSNTAASGALKAAVAEALRLKGKLESTRREIAQAGRQLQAIVDDQARLRANLERVPPTSEAYKRYLKKFDEQETEIEKLQGTIKRLRALEHRQRKAYEDYLADLNVE
jgi:hypothetical protein